MSEAFQTEETYLPIEDYALIGDLHTVAVVGKNGSIDWCCLPRFDAPSVFGSLLDVRKGGFFRISPSERARVKYKQLYLPQTNILRTRFLSSDGVGELTDFMPVKPPGTAEHQHHLVRSVSVIHGSLSFTLTCRPAFNYARDPHQIRLCQEGVLFQSQHFNLGLSSPLPLEDDGQGGVRATFTLHAGQSLHFMLESTQANDHTPEQITQERYQQAFNETLNYWRSWVSQCRYHGRWREEVQRSALVLKLLTYAPTGAIVAAATTSLPETIGGERNWDYRYSWLRDASFSLYSLLTLGFTEEAEAFMKWLDARCHELKDGGALQPMYGIDGKQQLTEITLDHLEGYRHSSSVRIARSRGWPAQIDSWQKTSSEIYQQIMTQGWSEQKQSFVQYYGSDAVDASALLMVTTNFTGPEEPRMQATIRRIQQELTSGSLVYRYNRLDAADDGLAGKEATFSACSFWLVEDLARAGYVDEARLQLEELLSYGNHVGLFAEEMNSMGEALGNYPQAFTHLALITACTYLDKALDQREHRVNEPSRISIHELLKEKVLVCFTHCRY